VRATNSFGSGYSRILISKDWSEHQFAAGDTCVDATSQEQLHRLVEAHLLELGLKRTGRLRKSFVGIVRECLKGYR
jgi:hypothetical protein